MKKRTLKSIILIASVLLLVMMFATALVYKRGSAPNPVSGLTAEACYAQMNLNWDKKKDADGYFIYMSEDGQNFEQVGETDKDTCKYSIKDYKHDTDYLVRVSAYATNALTGKKSESEPSDSVPVVYDSSKYAQKIPVLTYHGFSSAGIFSESSLVIEENAFDEQMKYLHDNGYTTLTPDEFYQWHAGKKEFPKKSVMITIDDGCYDAYYIAYPIIKKYGFSATLFCIGKNTAGVTPEFNTDVDATDYVRKDVIDKVREEYPRFYFESHTYNMHTRVDGKPPARVFTYDQLMDDFNKNKEYEFSYLAYPWGNYGDTIWQVLEDCNYKMAFAYRPFYYALRSDNKYAINRIKIKGRMPLDTFITICEGRSESRDNPEAPENQGAASEGIDSENA